MRKVFVFSLLLFLLFGFSVSAQTFSFEADDNTNLYDEIYNEYDGDLLMELSPEVVKDFADEFQLTPKDPFSFNKIFSEDGFEYLKSYVLDSLNFPLKTIVSILVTIIICALCNSIFDNNLQTNRTIGFISTLSVVTVLILPVNSVIIEAVDKVNLINGFMIGFIPVFAGILIACLKSGMASAYSSVMFFVCEAVSYVSKNLILPFVNCFTALSVATGISSSAKLNGLIKILKRAVYFILSACMTCFLIVLSLQGVVSNVADNAASKTAKFLISSFVPIIGPSLSESLGSLRGCVGLLKSSFGIYGLIAVLIVVLPVIIEIILFKFTFTLCADFSEMFGIGALKNLLDGLNQTLSVMLSTILCIVVMYVFSLTIILTMGGNV